MAEIQRWQKTCDRKKAANQRARLTATAAAPLALLGLAALTLGGFA
jgi:hypothetical protein